MNHPPFLLYLSTYCNTSAYSLGLANWWTLKSKQEGIIFYKGKKEKTKFQHVKPGAQLSILLKFEMMAWCYLIFIVLHCAQYPKLEISKFYE